MLYDDKMEKSTQTCAFTTKVDEDSTNHTAL